MNQKIYQDKCLVNDAMDSITELIWPHFRRAQLYERETGVHQIGAMTVQFPAKFSCGTAEQ
jgi:hypothetical protein